MCCTYVTLHGLVGALGDRHALMSLAFSTTRRYV